MQAKEIIQFLDLTSLNEQDNEESITKFLQKTSTSFGKVAAICIYPQFIPLAKKNLQKENFPLATVINFPKGDKQIEVVLHQAEVALENGADEIDVVINYKDYLLPKKNLPILFILCNNSKKFVEKKYLK